MSLPVTIENEALRVELYPHFGGKILSLIDKADEFELLFDYPAEFPTTPQYDQPYSGSYCAGWDECFPAVGPGPYPTHPYKGIGVPDHGELWGLPSTIVPIKDGIITEWQGLRFGYHFLRRLWLDGPVLNAEYTVQNLAPFDFHFVWSLHALASMNVPVELGLPGGVYRLSHDEEGRRIDVPFEWPVTAAGDRLDRPRDLPPKRGWKAFAVEPISAPAVVNYPSRGRSVSIEYSSADAVPAHWGVWVSTAGWAGKTHFAIEPTTGRFDELDRACKDGSAGRIPASGKLGWMVQWKVR